MLYGNVIKYSTKIQGKLTGTVLCAMGAGLRIPKMDKLTARTIDATEKDVRALGVLSNVIKHKIKRREVSKARKNAKRAEERAEEAQKTVEAKSSEPVEEINLEEVKEVGVEKEAKEAQSDEPLEYNAGPLGEEQEE